MTAAVRWSPESVSDALIALTNSLGEPSKDLVILAEGNTSELIDDEHIVVKVSGATMSGATADDFLVADLSALGALLSSPESDQEALTRALDGGEHGGTRRRASIETLLHVATQVVERVPFVAHTHPTAAVGLLSSVHASRAFEQPVYTDEAIVLGVPLVVPYAPPGIELGRIYHDHLRRYVDTMGCLPSLVALANHGIVALADSPDAAEAITSMAVKSARVRLAALSAGGINGLGAGATSGYLEREDFTERRRHLSGSSITAS